MVSILVPSLADHNVPRFRSNKRLHNIVFVTSTLRMKRYQVRVKNVWLGVSIMCPDGATSTYRVIFQWASTKLVTRGSLDPYLSPSHQSLIY